MAVHIVPATAEIRGGGKNHKCCCASRPLAAPARAYPAIPGLLPTNTSIVAGVQLPLSSYCSACNMAPSRGSSGGGTALARQRRRRRRRRLWAPAPVSTAASRLCRPEHAYTSARPRRRACDPTAVEPPRRPAHPSWHWAHSPSCHCVSPPCRATAASLVPARVGAHSPQRLRSSCSGCRGCGRAPECNK